MMRSIRCGQANNGFTLMELLLVVAVITILAGILMPVYFQSRNRARSVKCLSHLKQLGMAVSLYASDHSDRLPTALGSPFAGSWTAADAPEGTSSSHVCFTLRRYGKAAGMLACPNDRGAPAFGFRRGGSVFKSAGTSYLWNMTRRQDGWLANGQILSTLKSQDVLFQDHGDNWHGARSRKGLQVVEISQANAVFSDGRAASVETYSSSTDRGEYMAWATNKSTSGKLWVAGTTDHGSVYLCGTYMTPPSTGTSIAGVAISVHGMVYSDTGTYEVSRVFTLAADAGPEPIFRQIISWAEGIISQ